MRIVPPLLFLIHTVYSLYYMSDAVAECGHAQRYYSFFLSFVFALAERKNERQTKWEVPLLTNPCIAALIRE